ATTHDVEILTLYAFSTENWKRPKSEVDFLMKLPKEILHTLLPDLIKNNDRIDTIGEFDSLPSHAKKAIENCKEKTKNSNSLLFSFAVNYGSRYEIFRAMKLMVQELDLSKTEIDALEEKDFTKYLYTEGMTDPDLIIRTSGEKRLSNFLLWQSA